MTEDHRMLLGLAASRRKRKVSRVVGQFEFCDHFLKGYWNAGSCVSISEVYGRSVDRGLADRLSRLSPHEG